MTRLLSHKLLTVLAVALVVFGGYALHLYQDLGYEALEAEYNERILNEHHKIILGQHVVRLLMEIKADFYAMELDQAPGELLRSLVASSAKLVRVEEILTVLKEGGDLLMLLPVNTENHEKHEVTIHVDRARGETYVVPLLEMRAETDALGQKFQELEQLLNGMVFLTEWDSTADVFRFFNQRRLFYKQAEPLFVRMEQNSNKIYFDSHLQLEKLKRVIAAERVQNRRNEYLLTIGLFLCVFFLLYLILRQVMRTHDQLEQANKRLKNMFHGVSEVIYVVDLKTQKILFANRYAQQNQGMVPGQFCWQIGNPEAAGVCKDCRVFAKDPDCCKLGDACHWERSRGDHEREVHAQIIPWDGDRKVVLVISLDISDRKRAERERDAVFEQLSALQQNKLDSIGVLAGGIAHDFNNLLAVILGNLSLAEVRSQSTPELHALVKDASAASLRAKDLTQRLLTFATGGDPIRETESLPEILTESANFALSGSNVKCEYAIPDDLWCAAVDKSQFSQVVQNLIVNAKQAMSGGGRVMIACANRFVDEGEIEDLPAGHYVEINVEDNGPGIPAHLLGKIFDPYFSTKQKTGDQGSGLGLAIIHSIMKKHQGTIRVASEVGVGTRFSLYLPASYVYKRAQKVHETGLHEGQGRVLVMDDNAAVRNVTASMLDYLGYEVTTTETGEEALDLFSTAHRQGVPFDAVITDLTVPGGMGGLELATKILEIDSNARVLVSSGYSEDPAMTHYLDYGFCGRLQKPYQIDKVSHLLHDVLELNGKPGAVPDPERPHILLVDDEISLLKLYSSLLTSKGFAVTACVDGDEALQALREESTAFDLLFTDYMMPQMNGLMLAEACRNIQPDLPVVLMCGDRSRIDQSELEQVKINGLFEKPLDLQQILQAVKAGLQGQA